MKTTLVLAVGLLSSSSYAAVGRDALLEEALFAGGARSQEEMDRLLALYHQRVDPMVALIKDSPKQIAAQLLLKHLHVSYGGTTAVLKKYVMGAWSVNEALDTGSYNCVAASTLFLAAARQAGLEVTGHEYPRHVNVLLTVDGEHFVIEATSSVGFKPAGPDDWYLHTVVDPETQQLKVAVFTPRAVGDRLLLDAAWAWVGQPRDAQWAAHILPTPPPLISALP